MNCGLKRQLLHRSFGGSGLGAFGFCHLGRLIHESAKLEPVLIGKALVYLGTIWVLLHCGKSAEDLASKRRVHKTTHNLLNGTRPSKYDAAMPFLLGVYGVQLDKLPDTDLKAFGGLVSTIYLLCNSFIRQPKQEALKAIFEVSPSGFTTFWRSLSKRKVLQVESHEQIYSWRPPFYSHLPTCWTPSYNMMILGTWVQSNVLV